VRRHVLARGADGAIWPYLLAGRDPALGDRWEIVAVDQVVRDAR